MKRREFFMRIGGTVLAIPAVLSVAGCGGGDDDDDDDTTTGADAATGPTSFEGTTSGSDTSGHDHTFTVQCADLSNNSVTYNATGSGHGHTITLDGTQLAALAAGDTVEFDTADTHPHSWIVSKPSNAC